jgi:signal transduction histidine kinase
LRELDKQKTEFVSVASHQLRSPIAAIKGYTSMIVEGSFGDVPDTLREPLSRILESGKRIALMVDDFLNVTRIEQGRMTYAMEKHNICDLIHEAIEELRVIGEKKGLAFNLGCKDFENTPVFIRADSGKLKQVFSNIVDNAIKYTPAGSISVGIEVLPEHHAVLVRVKDTGIGIPPQDQDRLFHKFNRASNANTATVYGTGLGLYIAKEIVRAHNGWIHIHSDGEGKGTTFTIELPLWREGVVPEVKENDEE